MTNYEYKYGEVIMTKPYYNKDNAMLVHADTFQFLKKIKPESMDMIFADPPYFLSNGGFSNSGGRVKETGIKFHRLRKNMYLIENGLV